MAEFKYPASEIHRSSVNYRNAWSRLFGLFSLLLKAGCSSVDTEACIRMMKSLLSDGELNESRRVMQGLSVLNEVAGKEVVSYIEGAGRLVGFGSSEEVSPNEIKNIYEVTKEASELLSG